MGLKIQAKVTDEIKVTILPAPDILCVSCKKVIGKHTGAGKVVDKLGNTIIGKCPLCKKPWLTCIGGVLKIKTIEGLVNVE